MRNEVKMNAKGALQGKNIGSQFAQILALATLQAGGTGVVYQHAFSNTTTTLAYTAFNAFVNGINVYKAAGTVALTATTHDVAIDKWASYRVSMVVGGTIVITKQVAAEDDTEAAAIGHLAALPAVSVNLGYFTVRGGSAAIFDATTNNLATGAVTGMVVHYYPATATLSSAIALLG